MIQIDIHLYKKKKNSALFTTKQAKNSELERQHVKSKILASFVLCHQVIDCNIAGQFKVVLP